MKIYQPTGEKDRFERIVTIALILVFILVIVTGILSFVRLNNIIYAVNNAIQPDRPLMLAKEIYNDLGRADNIVKSYILTRNEQEMDRYTILIGDTENKTEELIRLLRNDDSLAPAADTVKVIVEEKFNILDMLVIISEEYLVEETGRVESIHELNQAEKGHIKEQELDLTRQDKLIMDKMRQLLGRMEVQTNARMQLNTSRAEEDASEVKTIIFTFGAATSLLLILAGTVIFLYTRKNQEYRGILKKARNDAEELARARQQFLANMSHEIKTPMNVISGYLRQLSDSPLNPQQLQQLEIINKSSDHLLRLLNNLLDMSRIQSHKLELVEGDCHPAELIRDMELWFYPAANEKGLQLSSEISPDTPPVIKGDPVRLRQVLFNLVSNAIKFTDKGSVRISVYPLVPEGDHSSIVFRVTDTGIGIKPVDQERIFREFSQGSISSERRSEGTGLGLTITSKLIELMEGKLELESSPGKGSVFTVTLPLRVSGSEEPAPGLVRPVPPSLPEGLKVLVVDDEEYNRSLLKLILGKHHCIITEASDGGEAVTLAGENRPDIILMDIRMPVVSGPEAAKKIREMADDNGKVIPVIAMSAGVSHQDLKQFRDTGIDDLVPKPFDEIQLLRSMMKLLSGQFGPKPQPVIPDKPVYSLQPLRDSSGGNEKFFLEMVHLFLNNTRAGLQEIDLLFDQGPMEKIPEIAHRISAPCKHLKAENLYKLMKQMEESISSGQVDRAKELSLLANTEFNRIRSDILSGTELKDQ